MIKIDVEQVVRYKDGGTLEFQVRYSTKSPLWENREICVAPEKSNTPNKVTWGFHGEELSGLEKLAFVAALETYVACESQWIVDAIRRLKR